MKREKILSIILTISILISIFNLFFTNYSIAANSEEEPNYNIYISGEYFYDYAKEVLKIVNEERAKENIPPLKMDQDLFNTANIRGAELAVLFSHDRPNGSDCFNIFPFGEALAENIAEGYGNPKGVMQGWMNSPGHRTNIMDATYKYIGISCFKHNNTLYWVQCFSSNGSEMTSYPKNETKQVELEVPTLFLEDYRIYVNSVLQKPSKEAIKIKQKEQKNIKVSALHGFSYYYDYFFIDSETFNFKSENEEIATVDAKGNITGVSEGKTKIVGELQDLTFTFYIEVEPPYILGDVNGDGNVNTTDARKALLYYIEKEKLTEIEKLAADVNKDGKVNTADARQILLMYIGK